MESYQGLDTSLLTDQEAYSLAIYSSKYLEINILQQLSRFLLQTIVNWQSISQNGKLFKG